MEIWKCGNLSGNVLIFWWKCGNVDIYFKNAGSVEICQLQYANKLLALPLVESWEVMLEACKR